MDAFVCRQYEREERIVTGLCAFMTLLVDRDDVPGALVVRGRLTTFNEATVRAVVFICM